MTPRARSRDEATPPDGTTPVAGLVLAAGAGRRLGQAKALVEVGGELLVERAVRTLMAASCAPIVVVVGAEADEVRRRAHLSAAVIVENRRWGDGMGGSLRCGLAELERDPRSPGAVVVALVDQPGVGAEAVARLVAAWRDGAVIAAASYHGQRGNPVLFDRALWGEAAAHARGDRGARGLLTARADIVRTVACEDVADPRDVDTPDDLRTAQAAERTTPLRPAPARDQEEARMQLTHTFTVPTGIDEAWDVLRDVERVAPCMPGATITNVEGDEFSGRVKVKVGPMQVTYKGSARFAELDHEQHRAVIEAVGQEAAGSGTATATVTSELADRDGETEVTLVTDLQITGRPAQFGRGVMSEVGDKLIGQFADCLAARLAGEADVAPRPAPPEPEHLPEAARMVHQDPAREVEEAIDVVDVAGPPVAKRVVPVVAALAAVWFLVRLVRRRR